MNKLLTKGEPKFNHLQQKITEPPIKLHTNVRKVLQLKEQGIVHR